jgi:hypothetical protein
LVLVVLVVLQQLVRQAQILFLTQSPLLVVVAVLMQAQMVLLV